MACDSTYLRNTSAGKGPATRIPAPVTTGVRAGAQILRFPPPKGATRNDRARP